MTREAIAQHFGVTRRTVQNWVAQGAPIKGGLIAIQKWRAEKKGEVPVPELPAGSGDSTNLRDRLLLAQAEHYETKTKLAELEHQVKTRQLIPLDEAEELIRRWVGPLAQQLRTQPERLAAKVNPTDPEHAREILRKELEALFKVAKEATGAND